MAKSRRGFLFVIRVLSFLRHSSFSG
jgi:hypothetical protein